MFNKWFINALKKRFKKMSVDEQNAVRELVEDPKKVDETKSDTKHKSKKVKKRRIKNMADEKEVEKKGQTSANDENIKTDEVKDNKVEEVGKTDEKVDENKNSKDQNSNQEPANDVDPTEQVQETEPQGNGIPLTDLVTKDILKEALSAMEAKFEAVVKENADLKDQLSKSQKDNDDLRDKYENKDFGNFNKQGMIAKDKDANSTFDEYSKQFM